MNTRNGPDSSWRGRGLVLLGRDGGVLAAVSDLGKAQTGLGASLLLWEVVFASSATVDARRGDCHLQWV